MQELMIFNGHEVEAFELDGRVYFNGSLTPSI